ncbi:MAG: hypothetical protein ACKOX6_07495 [Bdellovibrio sp.]
MKSLLKKSMLLALFSTCFLGSFTAYAAPGRNAPNRCLEQASNSELLGELSYRLKTTAYSPIENNIQYSFSCTYQNMKTIVTDLSTGASRVTDLNLDQSSSCTSVVSVLNRKIAQNRPGAVIAAVCNYQQLYKVVLLNGSVKLDTINLDQSSACEVQARAFNQ